MHFRSSALPRLAGALLLAVSPRVGGAQHPAPAPTVDTLVIPSAALGDTMQVAVRLPRDYGPSGRYPVLYTLQSGVWFDRLHLPAWMDSAEARGATAMIAVAIPDPDGLEAFRPDTPQGDAFVRFIAEELVPAVESRYAARAEPAGRLLLGFSAGANVLLDVAVRHPGAFGRMAAVSPGWMFRSEDGGLGVRFHSAAVANVHRAASVPATAFYFVWGDGPSEWERQSRVYGADVIAALRARGASVTDAGLLPGDHGLVLARNSLAPAVGFLAAP